MLIFFDFEVFKRDWLVVFWDTNDYTIIVNDRNKLRDFYYANQDKIFVGYNVKNYDQWIFKAILAGFDPKEVNDFIIHDNQPGYRYNAVLNRYKLVIYDVWNKLDKGLKWLEGSQGHSIYESEIDFDINRKLTKKELDQCIKYCKNDVDETANLFLERQADFNAQMELLKMFKLPISDLQKTKSQLSAKILRAYKKDYKDEFDLDIPKNLKIEKYKEVVDWFRSSRDYRDSLTYDVAGMKCDFGWGGIHGAKEKYIGEGYYLNMDVTSLYPSLMIEYNLHSRSCDPTRFIDIYNKRLQYKKAKDSKQQPLKIVLNSTYGSMKDKYNGLYDPRQNNRVCVHGQLLILDLIEHLEPYCEVIQTNTDGILIKMHNERLKQDDALYIFRGLVGEVTTEWQKRTRLKLEFDWFYKVVQKDVNNYVIIGDEIKCKGGYVKKLSVIDNDLPIVNKAIKVYIIDGVKPDKYIYNSNALIDFQILCHHTQKYDGLYLGQKKLDGRTARVFAGKTGKGLYKKHKEKQKMEKVAGTPKKCFIDNADITNKKVPANLDKNWYIDLTEKRLKDFGYETI